MKRIIVILTLFSSNCLAQELNCRAITAKNYEYKHEDGKTILLVNEVDKVDEIALLKDSAGTVLSIGFLKFCKECKSGHKFEFKDKVNNKDSGSIFISQNPRVCVEIKNLNKSQ